MEPKTVSTKQQRIAELARIHPEVSFTSLAYHIDIRWLYEAYQRTRKDGAVGVDEQTAEEYAKETWVITLSYYWKEPSPGDTLLHLYGGRIYQDHTHLRNILKRRVCDGVLSRLIGKWLNAGVMEFGNLSRHFHKYDDVLTIAL